MKYKNTWFSIIEVLIGILVVSIVMVWAFQTLTAVGVWKVKIIEKSSIEKESYFAAERLFELIKKGGTLDYEEYWNRTVINMSWGPLYQSGHYSIPSGFGNFWFGGNISNRTLVWNRPYFCLSGNASNMLTGWCLTSHNISLNGSLWATDYTWVPQRYWQYGNQFIDYNSDSDWDNGDEDGLSIGTYAWFFGDSDDLFLGVWPAAYTWSVTSSWQVQELYLINKNTNKRTLFRWNFSADPFAPTTTTCWWTQNITGSWCLGTIEMLELVWIDNGYDHWVYSDFWDGWFSDGDGFIDTWLIDRDFDPNFDSNSIWATSWMDYILAHNGWQGYWQPIFWDTIHVSNFEVYAYPNKDPELSWRDTDLSLRVAPYVQVKITLQPSWKVKRQIKWDFPSTEIITTIQLSDLNFQ